jgi:hypothetical protein
MKTYKIPVSWEVCGSLEVSADSLDEAIRIAEEDETPLPEGGYVYCSFNIDFDTLFENYPEEGEELSDR